MPETTLYELAHARTGDKGNRINICVFAYESADYPTIVEALTEARVAAHFAQRSPTSVKRYLLPKLHGVNLVLDDVLDGGVNDSLNLDMHGKSLSYHLLSMPVQVLRSLAKSDSATS